MIRRLRVKFVTLSMASLLLVLFLIVGGINVTNYRSILEDADKVLDILAAYGGMFPEGSGEESFPEYRSPEVPYESRYFSVLLDEQGAVISTNTGQIAAIDTQTAITYAELAFRQGKTRGFLYDYRYVALTDEFGSRIIFLDCGRFMTTFRDFLLASCGISAVGLLAVFLLIVLLSGWIIRPVSESYEKQKRFITDAGHEIKTPLTIIEADVDILEMEAVDENEWLHDIKKQTARLTALTNDLIYLSRMEEEGQQRPMLTFALSEAVLETAGSFQALSRTRNLNFSCHVQPDLYLCGEEKAIRQLLSILLDNAVKYADENGEVSLSLEKQNRMIRLTVFNTTQAAVPRRSMEHLFDRFYRTDASRNSHTGGYGIGLSIARAIVAAHKGKIAASTKDEQSLLITVTLPAGERQLLS